MAEKGSHTVLVVDDDPGHRGMLEALLGRWGLAVTSAGDGKEAVARVCERPFDVVLMDIRMPDMDGITALKEIRKYNPAVPVVLMTAYSAVESAVEAMKSGAEIISSSPSTLISSSPPCSKRWNTARPSGPASVFPFQWRASWETAPPSGGCWR